MVSFIKSTKITLAVRLLILSLFGLLLSGRALAAMNAVTLVSFDAFPGDEKVDLIWVTASEIDNAGFYISRSTSPTENVHSGSYRIHPDLIPSDGDPLGGSIYFYTDHRVTNGLTYFYWLESVSAGGVSEFHVPEPVIPGLAAQPLASPTPTQTSTQTLTTVPSTQTASPSAAVTVGNHQPQNSPTLSPSPTRPNVIGVQNLPTSTHRPSPTNTPVPTPTPTVTYTASPTPTETLEPLPEITLQFPTPTRTPRPTRTPSPTPTQELTWLEELDENIPLGLKWIGGLIVVIWILLAGFLTAYIRRISH
jgi:hypothetical protein